MYVAPSAKSSFVNQSASLNKKLRLTLAIGTSFLLIFSFVLATAIFATRPDPRISLKVSLKPDRSDAIVLEGASLKGNTYVFLDVKSVKRAAFYLDGFPIANKSVKPISVDKIKPYDFTQTNSDLTARPFDFSKLSEGKHSIFVIGKLKNGKGLATKATFNVGLSKMKKTIHRLRQRKRLQPLRL